LNMDGGTGFERKKGRSLKYEAKPNSCIYYL